MITLANSVNSPLYVVHVMSKLAADEVARGRQRGNVVFGETLGKDIVCDYTY
jgi:dihydropyrimidinase